MKSKKSFSLYNTIPKELVNKTILNDGLTLLSEYLPNSGTFSLGIHIKSGSRNEESYPNGIAHFIEHYVFRKNRKYSNKQIALKFENLGAVTNAFTTKEQISFYVTALNSNFTKVFNLLYEICFHPDFTDYSIEKEKEIIINEIQSYEDDHEEMIFEEASKILYSKNELESSITGDIESVKNINKSNLMKFHQENFTSDNVLISLAGGIPHSDLIEIVEKVDINPKSNSKLEIITPSFTNENKQVVKQNIHQSHLLHCKFIPNKDPDLRYNIALINIMLGDGMSSRLYLNLREKKALAYNIYSAISNLSDLTEIAIYTSFSKRNSRKIEDLINAELNELNENGFNEEEIKRAKEVLKTYTVMENESSINRMNIISSQEMIYGNHESVIDSIKKIESMNKPSIDSTLKLLNPSSWVSVKFSS